MFTWHNSFIKIKEFFTGEANQTLLRVEDVSIRTEQVLSAYTVPVRKSILKRFPVMFALLVTTGASATFLGIEQMILKVELLRNYPVLVLVLGITILGFTGKLYKKLS